jgi:hypothetical protein
MLFVAISITFAHFNNLSSFDVRSDLISFIGHFGMLKV